MQKGEYVRIQEIWSKPETSKPKKNPAELEHCKEQPPNNKHRNESHRPASGSPSTGTPEPSVGQTNKKTQCQSKLKTCGQNILTNIRTIEKVVEVPETNKNLEFGGEVDWEKVLREHKERIEKEENDRNNKLEQQSRKVDSWKLYNLCKQFLEENSPHWNKRRELQIEENQRLERLEIAKSKSTRTKNKERPKKWEKKFQEGLEKVPVEDREQQEAETRLLRKRELQVAKQNLWKLRTKEKKLIETEEVLEIRSMEKKAEQVFSLLEKEKNRLMVREQNVRKSIKNGKEPIKKQKLLAEIWTTYRWITEYLLETTAAWELENNSRKEQHKKRLEDKTRIEKIEHIKKTTITEQQQVDIQDDKQQHQENHETPNNVVWKLSQETTNIENQEIAKGIVIQLIEQTVNQSTKKQQTIPETEDMNKKTTTEKMITNNSKSKKQQKINNYFGTDQQDANTTKSPRNKELISTPTLKLEQKTTTKTTKKSLP